MVFVIWWYNKYQYERRGLARQQMLSCVRLCPCYPPTYPIWFLSDRYGCVRVLRLSPQPGGRCVNLTGGFTHASVRIDSTTSQRKFGGLSFPEYRRWMMA